jgi:hypothetical protein
VKVASSALLVIFFGMLQDDPRIILFSEDRKVALAP